MTIVFHICHSKILQNITFEINLSLVPCHAVSKLPKKRSEKQKDKKLLQKENINHLINDFLGKKGSIKT